MAPAEGRAPAGAARPRGAGTDTARTRVAPPPEPRTWFDHEPALGPAGWRAIRRLARRSRASWPLWLGAALLISAGLTARRAWAPTRYEVTTVLRVSEGALDASGSNLNGGALRAYVNERAFRSEHLTEIMKRHPEWFGGLAVDPELALIGFRSAMDVSFSENGFVEDRGPGDPPRSARIAVTFRARTPGAAWTIAHELDDLLIGSALAGQRADVEREAAAAADSLRRAQDDLSRAVLDDPTGNDPRVRAARERWRKAQAAAAGTEMAVHAAAAQQTLRLDLVDPGRKPEDQKDPEPLVTRFIVSFLATILAGWLLAGAFDPRVLYADDVEMVGFSVLGQLPLLPARLPSSSAVSAGDGAGEGGRKRPRV
ncbi:MAG TPA: hypothetical protein VFH68_04310 [Polyangia bacterium]|nr:hypothetical protein [Polyangia bacterium]